MNRLALIINPTRKTPLFLPIIALLSILLTIPTPAYAAAADDIVNISGRSYYPAVKKAIEEAKESIYLVMYNVSLQPYDKSSQVYELVNGLVRAKERGIEVRVILDQNIDFVGAKSVGDWTAEGKNAWCFKVLKEAGIDAEYDDLTTYTHAKAMIIDKKIVIIGSANWSQSAFNRNVETNVLVKSEKLARELLDYFKEIKIDKRAGRATPSPENSIPVSWAFLENSNLAGRMLRDSDERVFDVYLLLLMEFDGNPEGRVVLNYDKTAGYLGLESRMTRAAYRRQITKTLRKLEERYKLIKFQPQYAEDAVIALLSYDNPEKPYSYPKEWYFQIPDNFWKYGWNRELSFSAKFCYLINLAYASISNSAPWWFSSRELLAKRFNTTEGTITEGMAELRKQNLIDVLYDAPKDGSYSSRLAKTYKLMPLYDPEWLEAEWDRLKFAYGAKELNAARKYAGIVFKENDPEIVEEIINMMDSAGEGTVSKAFSKVAKKAVDNPKRNYAYTKGIIKSLEK